MPLFNPAVIGGPLPGATQGSVLFAGAGGVFAQDATNFVWNDTDNSLLLAATPPAATTKASLLLGNALVSASASGTWIGINAPSGVGARFLEMQANNVKRFIFTNAGNFGIGIDPSARLHISLSDAATNTQDLSIFLDHITSATAAAGFGGGIGWRLEDDSGTLRVAARDLIAWQTAASGTRKCDRFFWVADAAGEREALRLSTDGTVAYAFQTGDPPASASLSKLGLGSAISGGSASGTFLGINAPSGYTGRLAHWQLNGADRFRVDGTGQVTIDSTASAVVGNVTPTAAVGAFLGLDFTIDTTGLSAVAGWRGISVNRTGSVGYGGSSFFLILQDANVNVFSLDTGGELSWKPLSLSGFGSFKYDGANTSAGYGFFRAINAQDGINFRNAFTTDDGSGVGFRLSVTDSGAYTPVTNLAAKVLVLGTGQGGYEMNAWSITAGGLIDQQRTDAATNTVSVLQTLRHNTSGSVANGFGSQIVFQLEDSTTEDQDVGALSLEWADKTHASRSGRGKLWASYTTTPREVMRWEANATVPLWSVFGVAAQGQQTVNAAAVDPATTMALTNQLRAALIGFGLCV